MIRWSCQRLQGWVPVAAEPDAEAIGKSRQLRTPLAHPFRGLREVRAASRPDLDLGRDQLADEVLVDVGSLARRPAAPRSGS